MTKKVAHVSLASPEAPRVRKTLAVLVSMTLGTAPSWVQGQTLEEIIVTATKRKSNRQDLPQTITAFTTEDIERQGFNVLDDYARKIPSLAFARREPAGTSVVFRGVAASGIQYGTNPSASVYLDEAAITQAGLNPDPRLVDIERIEALSGPQGTLFGDASQSGTLRIITNKPQTTELSGWIEADLSRFTDSEDLNTDFAAMVNLPIIEDQLAIRLVGFTSKEAGYIDNVLATNQPDIWENSRRDAELPLAQRFNNADLVDEDVNAKKTIGGRAALRWQVNEDWTVDIAGLVQNLDADGFGDVNLGVGEREQVRFEDETLEDDWYQLSINLEGALGFADTVLTASYFSRELTYEADATDYLHDFDQQSDPALYSIYDFTGAPRGFVTQDQEDERWTLEGRLTSPRNSDSRWSGLAGFFYGKLDREQFNTSQVRNFSHTDDDANQGNTYLNELANSPDDNPNYQFFHNSRSDNWFFGAYDLEIDQTAVFGEVTWAATERLNFTAGARWFKHEQIFLLQQGSLLDDKTLVIPRNYLFSNELKTFDENDWVPKLNAAYQLTDDVLTYLTYSEGFRSGGGNALRSNSSLPGTYNSDKLKNYELGLKSEWFASSLRFNAVAYHMVWEDIQIQVNDPELFSLGIINFSEAEIDGFEAELNWLPAPGWDISANVAINRAEISQNDIIFTPNGDVIAEVGQGTQLPISPKEKGSIAVQYTFEQPLWAAEAFVRLDWSYIGDSVNSLNGTESIVFTQGTTLQPAYDIGNLRFGLEAAQWSGTIYVNNFTDEVAQQFFSNRWGSQQRVSLNAPRTMGLNLRWKF